MAEKDKEYKLKEIAKGLKQLEKEGWKMEELQVERPAIDDPKASIFNSYIGKKPGPDMYITIHLTSSNSYK